MNPKPNGWALLPIAVFLVLYLGCGIWFEYIQPQEGQMGFYVMSVVVAFSIALVTAFFQNRALSFKEKIHVCAQGIGDDNIVIMLFIFLAAGAFSGIAKAAGGASSTAGLLLSLIPGRLAIPGLFVIACLISMAMGTSVGTITVLAPIASGVASGGGFDLALCVGTVIGGAMFGDNLSFISDTTIAATRTQGVAMKDKFRTNFRIAAPAALATLAVLVVYALRGGAVQFQKYDFSIPQALPYFVVLALSIGGVNVFIILGIGIILFLLAGLFTGSLTFASALTSMGDGTSGMFETMIVTILAASIASLIREDGGFSFLLQQVHRHCSGKRSAMVGIGLLVSLMDIASANNTVAIVITGPIAKKISEEYRIEPKMTASLLDAFSCVVQGIIPYGAQILVAAGLTGLTGISIVPHTVYPFFLLTALLVSIWLDR